MTTTRALRTVSDAAGRIAAVLLLLAIGALLVPHGALLPLLYAGLAAGTVSVATCIAGTVAEYHEERS